ncbi:unnamed protein product [Peronospora belbahrii]|uniref:Thaumatin n=1 Tax=Peronospora belbahrii TaxID=622444 RepID=A0ABN8CRQ8_9STRA|nr:unnamed protein product [Peronospora belbahrii]
MTFTNRCPTDITLYTRLASVYTDNSEVIASGASITKMIGKGYEGHFRNGTDDAATLVEVSTVGEMDIIWYDIGIIPSQLKPDFKFCKSHEECKQNSESGKGFNTPVKITPKLNTNGKNCRELLCLADGCEDAYNFPQDDTKTHSCPFGTDFDVTFCPSGGATQQQEQTAGSLSTTTLEAKVMSVDALNSPVQQTEVASDSSDKIKDEVKSETTAAQPFGAKTSEKEVTGAETLEKEVTGAETPKKEVTPAVATDSKYCV